MNFHDLLWPGAIFYMLSVFIFLRVLGFNGEKGSSVQAGRDKDDETRGAQKNFRVELGKTLT
jgi:hypothetical protein